MGSEKENMEEIKSMFEKISTQLTTVETKLDKSTATINELKQENQELKRIIKEQEGRLELVEKEIRRNNIVIQGVADKAEEKQEEVEEKVQGILAEIGVEINPGADIKEITKLGTFKPNKKRPILVKLHTWKKKLEIFEQTKHLKRRDIWINDDYTKKVQEDRKRLMPHLKQARQEGHTAYLRYNRMIVNNSAYSLESLNTWKRKKR